MAPRRGLLEQYVERPLAYPCEVGWGEMEGGDKERWCPHCEKTVLNVSAMTPTEAEIRLLNVRGVPCINYTRDAAGRVIFAAGSPAHRPSRGISTGALAVASVLAVLPAAACNTHKSSEVQISQVQSRRWEARQCPPPNPRARVRSVSTPRILWTS